MATTTYATLAELKARLKIDDTDDDAALTSAISAASRDIDQDTGRRFWLDDTATARTYNPRGRTAQDCDGWRVLVDDIGDVTGLVVEVGSGSSWAAVTAYETGPDNAMADGRAVEYLLRPTVPWTVVTTQRIRVTAKFGWPTVPDPIHEACLLRAARLFRRRDSPEGVAGNSDFGVVRVSRWDPDYDALIGPYVLPGIG